MRRMPSIKDFTNAPAKIKSAFRWMIAALLLVIALQFVTIAILLFRLH